MGAFHCMAVSQCCTILYLCTSYRCGLFGPPDAGPRFAVARGNPHPQPVPGWGPAVSQSGGVPQEHRNIRLHHVTLICRAPHAYDGSKLYQYFCNKS